jgi:hypothetical protein
MYFLKCVEKIRISVSGARGQEISPQNGIKNEVKIIKAKDESTPKSELTNKGSLSQNVISFRFNNSPRPAPKALAVRVPP